MIWSLPCSRWSLFFYRSVPEVHCALSVWPGVAVCPLHVPHLGGVWDFHTHHGSQRHRNTPWAGAGFPGHPGNSLPLLLFCEYCHIMYSSDKQNWIFVVSRITLKSHWSCVLCPAYIPQFTTKQFGQVDGSSVLFEHLLTLVTWLQIRKPTAV